MPVLFLSTTLLNSPTVNAEKKIFFTRKTCKFQSKASTQLFFIEDVAQYNRDKNGYSMSSVSVCLFFIDGS